MIVHLPPNAGPLARNIYARMTAAGMNQSSLAQKAGLGRTYVRDIFRGGSRNPKQQELRKLADALGCTLSDLTGAAPLEDNKLDPGMTRRDEPGGQVSYSESEIALIEMWRVLTPAGKNMVIAKILEALPSSTGVAKANDN